MKPIITRMTVLLIGLTLISCSLFSPTTGGSTPGGATSLSTASAATAAAAGTATAAVAPTLAPSETPVPTPAAQISAQNVPSLKTSTLDLSSVFSSEEYPRTLAWPSTGEVDIFTGQKVLLVQVDSLSYDAPAPLTVNGTLFAIAPDASALVAGNPGGQAAIYDLAGNPRFVLDEPSAYGADYSGDGQYVAVMSSSEWAVSVYSAASGQRITRLTGFETAAPVYSASIAPGGKTLAWMARATLHFQDVASGAMGVKVGFEDFIMASAFSTDGSKLAVYAAQAVHVFDCATGQETGKISVSEPVRALVFSPDGSLLAAAYGSGIQVWDAATLAPVANFAGQAGPFNTVSFSPDGRTLTAVNENRQLMVWQPD